MIMHSLTFLCTCTYLWSQSIHDRLRPPYYYSNTTTVLDWYTICSITLYFCLIVIVRSVYVKVILRRYYQRHTAHYEHITVENGYTKAAILLLYIYNVQLSTIDTMNVSLKKRGNGRAGSLLMKLAAVLMLVAPPAFVDSKKLIDIKSVRQLSGVQWDRQLFEAIGSGTFANVYRLHNTFALKCAKDLRGSQEKVDRQFRHEAYILSEIEHMVEVYDKNIHEDWLSTEYGVKSARTLFPRFYDHVDVSKVTALSTKHPYGCFLMDFVEGGSLRDLKDKVKFDHRFRGNEGIKVVLSIIRQLSAALDFFRSRSIIHHDIKAENILLSFGTGGGVKVQITDFGGAVILEDPPTNDFIENYPQSVMPKTLSVNEPEFWERDLFMAFTNSPPISLSSISIHNGHNIVLNEKVLINHILGIPQFPLGMFDAWCTWEMLLDLSKSILRRGPLASSRQISTSQKIAWEYVQDVTRNYVLKVSESDATCENLAENEVIRVKNFDDFVERCKWLKTQDLSGIKAVTGQYLLNQPLWMASSKWNKRDFLDRAKRGFDAIQRRISRYDTRIEEAAEDESRRQSEIEAKTSHNNLRQRRSHSLIEPRLAHRARNK